MNKLMQEIYVKFCKQLNNDYDFIQKTLDTTTVPYVKEFIQKYLEWENDKDKVGKLYEMFPEKSGCSNPFFHLSLVLNNYVINHNEYKIIWIERNTRKIVSSNNWGAIPIVVHDKMYHPLEESAKKLLNAMEQWELNDKQSYEYHKKLADEGSQER